MVLTNQKHAANPTAPVMAKNSADEMKRYPKNMAALILFVTSSLVEK